MGRLAGPERGLRGRHLVQGTDWAPLSSADLWWQDNDMGAGYCTPHMTEKGWAGCGYGDCVGKITCSNC